MGLTGGKTFRVFFLVVCFLSISVDLLLFGTLLELNIIALPVSYPKNGFQNNTKHLHDHATLYYGFV